MNIHKIRTHNQMKISLYLIVYSRSEQRVSFTTLKNEHESFVENNIFILLTFLTMLKNFINSFLIVFLQFGNDTNDPSNADHEQARPLTQNELENVESRMMLRNLHLTERCTLHGLDQRGK